MTSENKNNNGKIIYLKCGNVGCLKLTSRGWPILRLFS